MALCYVVCAPGFLPLAQKEFFSGLVFGLVGLSGPFVALVSGPGVGAGRRASSQLPTPIPFLLGLYKSGRPPGKNHTQNDLKQKIKVMIGVRAKI